MLLLSLLLACTSVDAAGDTAPTDTDLGSPHTDTTTTAIVINEFMASNDTTVTDELGESSDWLELYNAGDAEVDLDGWSVTDGTEVHTLEDLTLAAGAHLLLWASGSPELGPTHLAFRLDRSGGELSISDGSGAEVDAIAWPEQVADVSATRARDGGPHWVLTTEPTPGEAGLEEDPGTPEADAPEGSCALEADLDERWLLEGDDIALTLSCTGELAQADADIEALSLPGDATFDAETLAFSWRTGVADAGPADLVFSVRGRGATTTVPSGQRVRLWIADDPSNPSNEPVDPETYTQEWGLPVFHFSPDGELSQSYTSASLYYDGVAYDMEMKIRGATSASYAKSSYTLDFDDKELEVDGWDGSREHVVLISNFDDNSYIRQKLVFDMWAEMADYWEEDRLVCRSFFAVVYFDTAYHGLYTVVDHIDRDLIDRAGLDEDGNLYKAVNHDANFALTGSSGGAKSSLADGYEKKEGTPEDDFSDLEELVSFTGNSSSAELIDGAADWLSLAEFMDWFLLVHYAHAEDSAGKNSYLYNDPDATRFYVHPWDFNHSWGQNWYTSRRDSDSLSSYTSTNRVFWAIQDDEVTEEALWDRFRTMREDGPFSPDWIDGTVADYYDLIEPSAERDWDAWAAEYRSAWWAPYRDDWTSWEEERAYVEQWLEERAELFAIDHP